MNTIQSGWESYERDVITPTAGPIQRHETKAGFYAGVTWMIKLLASDVGSGSEDATFALLQSLYLESVDFAKRGIFESHANAVRASAGRSPADVSASDLGKDADPI